VQGPTSLHGAQAARHKRAASRAASRDQLPLLPADPAANDSEPGAGSKK
jgi:hypothetical protein